MKSKLLLIASFLLFFAGSNPTEPGYSVGDTVADFELKSVEGEMVSLSGYEDAKGFILIFDCNTCPYSKAYRDRIKDLHAQYADQGFPVVAVQPNDPGKSPGDSFENMQSYAKEHGYEHAYLYDETQEVAKRFGATNTPHVYVLEKESEGMVVRYIGAIDNNTKDADAADKKYVEDAVNALLEGDKPEVTKTKAIGCTIKWRAS